VGIPADSQPGSSLAKHCPVSVQALLKDVKGIGEEGYGACCTQSVLAEDDLWLRILSTLLL